MKRFSEEEQEELDRISEAMAEIDFDKSKREQEIIEKLKEPEEEIEQPAHYKRPTKRVMSTMAMLSMYASSCLGSGKRESYPGDFKPVRIKGAPGVYNPEKHLSRAQRKKKKNKINKTSNKKKR